MTRVQAVARLEGLIQGHWNTIATIKARKDLTKAEIREWSSRHKLDIEALQLARAALKNPGYSDPRGVTIETGVDD